MRASSLSMEITFCTPRVTTYWYLPEYSLKHFFSSFASISEVWIIKIQALRADIESSGLSNVCPLLAIKGSFLVKLESSILSTSREARCHLVADRILNSLLTTVFRRLLIWLIPNLGLTRITVSTEESYKNNTSHQFSSPPWFILTLILVEKHLAP